MSLEMYGKELDHLELNELFYEQPNETVKVFGTEVFNYKIWEKNCLWVYDSCQELGMKSSHNSREDYHNKIKDVIKEKLYKEYKDGIGFIL